MAAGGPSGPGDLDAARLAFSRNEPAGFDTHALPGSQWHFIPLRTQRGSFGVVGIASKINNDPFDAEARALLGTLAEQTAAAFDRVFLADEMMAARSVAETERVRNISAGVGLSRFPHSARLDTGIGNKFA